MTHRSYQSVLPTHNKFLQKRWDDAYFHVHRHRVQTALPVVTTAAPKVYPHIVNKLKKKQNEDERLEMLQRDNNTLMLHMGDIMKKGGCVKHRNLYDHRSLNYKKRVNELQRIQTENMKMLCRIESRPPNYSAAEWVKDRGEKERLLRMISVHPQSYPKTSYGDKVGKSESLTSLIPLSKEKFSTLEVEVTEMDTVDSLQRDLEIARSKIPQISKSCLNEIKSICLKPPTGVKLVIDANSILFTHTLQPFARITMTPRDFQSFDKDKIPYSVLERLKPYIDSPEFNADNLRCVNLNIVSLMEWIKSIYQYGIVMLKMKKVETSKEQKGTTPVTPPT